MNVVDPILFQCRLNAPAPAICAPGTEFNLVSYARLERFIHNVSRRAIALGLQRGQIVAVFVTDSILHAAIILGLMRLGIVTVSGRNPQLPKELNVAALIADTSFPYQAPRIIRADQNWVAGDGKPIEEQHVPRTSPDDICQIVLTSGTTGYSKAVALTHRMIAERIIRRFTSLGNVMPQCSRTYCGPGFSTALGAEFLIYVLWRGGTFFCPGASIDLLIRAFVDFEVDNMVTAPAGLADLLSHYEQDKTLQHRFKVIMAGGSLLSSSLSDRVRARICSNVLTAYGSSETGLIASAAVHAIAKVPGAVGYLVPGISVEIVDRSGAVLPPETEGAIRIRSPSNIVGYCGDPAESQVAFRDGWFHPGDVGRLTRDKLLVISGREKAVVNLGGDTVKPEMIEEVIISFDGIEQAGVFGVTNELGIEELWSLVVPSSKWDEAALRAHCALKLPRTFIPIRFIVVDTLPLNDMGKLERHRLPEIAKAKLN